MSSLENSTRPIVDRPLAGVRVLIVEDDALIAMELEAVVQDAGGEVVGLCRNIPEVLEIVDGPISLAILDLRLGDQPVSPVARLLTERRIPFFFYSGQAANDPISSEWPETLMVSKPALAWRIVATATAVLR